MNPSAEAARTPAAAAVAVGEPYFAVAKTLRTADVVVPVGVAVQMGSIVVVVEMPYVETSRSPLVVVVAAVGGLPLAGQQRQRRGCVRLVAGSSLQLD